MVAHSSYSDSLTVEHAADEQRSASNHFSEDEDVRQRVRLFLTGSNLPGLRHLAIDVTGGTVMLCGHVRTFYEKQLAIGLSCRVAGVIHVIDRIEVESYPPRVETARGPLQRKFVP